MSTEHHSANDALQSERILDTALILGERLGWDSLHLYDIAQEMKISLAEIHRHYRQKDDLTEAWFDRADRALLAAPELPEWSAQPPSERLFLAIMTWLDALDSHRKLTGAMLGYKLHPEHLHLQAHGITRISRTVQWIREVSLLPSTGLRQEAEEIALTGIYLSTLARWLHDQTPDSSNTRNLLRHLLEGAEYFANEIGNRLPGSRQGS